MVNTVTSQTESSMFKPTNQRNSRRMVLRNSLLGADVTEHRPTAARLFHACLPLIRLCCGNKRVFWYWASLLLG